MLNHAIGRHMDLEMILLSKSDKERQRYDITYMWPKIWYKGTYLGNWFTEQAVVAKVKAGLGMWNGSLELVNANCYIQDR